MARVVGADKYGDWSCHYCNRYIRDTRVLRRREVEDVSVPVCLVCDALLVIIDPEWIHSDKYRYQRLIQNLRIGFLERDWVNRGGVVEYKGEVWSGAPADDEPVMRMYVNRGGGVRPLPRREPKE